MANIPSLVATDPYRWHESVLSTRSLSYMSTISAIGTNGLPSPLISRNGSLAHLYQRPQSNVDEDSEYELEIATRKERAKTLRETLPASVAKSLLFTLPREIRDRIYYFCLATPATPTVDWPVPSPYMLELAPQLLRTCRVVFSEAAPLLYQHNNFAFTHPSDANLFTRAVCSQLHSGQITSLTLHVRASELDVGLWTGYFHSSKPYRGLRSDFPGLQDLTVQYRSYKWTGAASVENNMREWSKDKQLDTVINGLRHVFYPQQLEPDIDVRAATTISRDTDAAMDHDDAGGLPMLKQRQSRSRQLRPPPPRIRVVCMCRVNSNQYMLLTSPPTELPDQPPRPHVARILEGDEFIGFNPVDLQERGTRVVAHLATGKVETLVARTVFADNRDIMLALEIFCVDPAHTGVRAAPRPR